MKSFIDYAYSNYRQANKLNWVRPVHHRLTTSRLAARLLFGMRLEPDGYERTYFDLTTFLLHSFLKRRVARDRDLRFLEIGAGQFAILSGGLARWATHTIDAVEVYAPCIEPARRHVALNARNVNVFVSDLFSNVPAAEYDVIFWNLPYYRDPNRVLNPLFETVPDFLAADGELVLGYNTAALKRQTVLGILKHHDAVQSADVKCYWWNQHEILVLRRAQGLDPGVRDVENCHLENV